MNNTQTEFNKITRRFPVWIGALGCAAALALPLTAVAADVTEAEFNALKETVRKLADDMQKLQQTHVTDEQTHKKDQEEIQQLKTKLGETQQTANAAQMKANEAAVAAQMQPVNRTPLDEATVNHNFSILGDAEFQYAKTQGLNGSFLLADFAPIFLYRGGDSVLFEAGFDFILQNNAPGSSGYATTLNLSFAQLNYIINDYMTLSAGNILLPLGTYSERTAGWLNKIPDDPMPRDLLPGSGVGLEVRGAVPFGQSGSSLAYAVWGVNGPGSADGMANAGSLDLGGNVGLRSDNAVANLHGKPSGGARLGMFMPFKPKYDLEVGLSGQAGEWDNGGNHMWYAGVLDASMHLGPYFEAKGEYVRTGYGSDDVGNVRTEGWWGQVGYKLAGLKQSLPFINNLEAVARYDRIRDGLGMRTERYSVGGIYYLSNTLLFDGIYEFLHSSDPTQPRNQFILQLSYGF